MGMGTGIAGVVAGVEEVGTIPCPHFHRSRRMHLRRGRLRRRSWARRALERGRVRMGMHRPRHRVARRQRRRELVEGMTLGHLPLVVQGRIDGLISLNNNSSQGDTMADGDVPLLPPLRGPHLALRADGRH